VDAIEIQKLTKRYGKARGVEDLSFSVAAGEVFGYLGPNGSGKTTTIRCLMGLLRPTSGKCFVFGQRVKSAKATQHSRIGYLPGEFRIWPWCSAEKSLKLMAALGSRDYGKRRYELAQRLDLDLGRKIGALSKGNRQKAGIIYAFQHQPDVLILDEPTIGLDPLVRQIVLDLMREAAQQGAAVLLSSHDLSEVSAVCERAAILREGRLIELASISKIVQKGEKHLKVWFAEGTGIPELPAARLPGVRIIAKNTNSFHIAYQGSTDSVLKWLATYRVERIAAPETSLEDAFIQYYKKEAGNEK
jgi:ABC-2 type transport system ATP-binding protein